jgi:signal transduction histidine kinase
MLEFDRRYVLIPVLIALVLVASAYFATEVGRQHLIATVRDIQESQHRARLLVELQALISDAEAAQRGYVLTADASYLKPYNDAKKSISARLTDVQSAYGGSERATMHARATKLIELSAAKLTELDSTVVLYEQGVRQAMAMVRTRLGAELMEQIRGLVVEMGALERELAVEQTAQWLNIHERQRVLSSVGALLNVVLIVLAGYLVTRDIRRRTSVASGLETEVAKKNMELTELSTHLQQISETEKSALARELHDELGGLLVSIKMDLAQLRTQLDLSQQDVQKRWDRIQSALSSGIDLKRRIIEQLRPSLLDNMGLTAAIGWQAGEICNAAGLKLTQHYTSADLDISSDAAIAIFRIAQEALTNVAKHAHATQVSIDVAIADDELMLVIEDDGVGLLNNRTRRVASHGLKSMRHRLLPYDGQLNIERVEPSGTRIRVRVALSKISTRAQHEALQDEASV